MIKLPNARLQLFVLTVLAALLMLAACTSAELASPANVAVPEVGAATGNGAPQSTAPANETASTAVSLAGESALMNANYAYDDEATFIDLELLPAEEPPFSTGGWETDFTRRVVAWDEILSGGPPKDGIPAVDDPTFETVDEAGAWLSERDPVIVFANNGEVKAYPLAILMWHEIVNDEVGGLPVTVTFCPLCNASIVFASQLDDRILDFGTTGRLRNSDLIMYDRQTETWWQQFTGQAIVGEHVGRQLNFLPSRVISFADYAERFPDGAVLARPSFPREYGRNPYTNYDSRQPFLFTGEIDERLRATERVVGLEIDGDVVAYPFSTAAAEGAINDRVGDVPIVIFHKAGTASALDSGEIAAGRDIGSAAVFDRRIDQQTLESVRKFPVANAPAGEESGLTTEFSDRLLTFSPNADGTFRDAETGSTWNILGEAVAGEMAGAHLDPVLAFDHFWFAWQAFYPETKLFAIE